MAAHKQEYLPVHNIHMQNSNCYTHVSKVQENQDMPSV